jgi:Starch-binding associating with outer membrane
MINIKKIYALLVVTLLLATSCTKNFEEFNTDPNRPKNITPGVILGQMQYRIVNTSMRTARGFTHELMQVDAPRSSTSGEGLHRYTINPGAGVWSNFYSYLTDIEDINKTATDLKENNYKAISLVYKSWAYSILTDLYGDVPYSQATKATEGNFTPAFDKQKDIYVKILADLEEANTLFDATKALTYGGDLLYNANSLSGGTNAGILKWKKFTNSLRLRLLLRISKRDGEVNVNQQITSILADPVKYPVFTSNADEAIFKYPGTFPYFNPYFNERQLEWRDGTYVTKFFINKMNSDNDPRRPIWFSPITVGTASVYQGIESGYPVSTEYQVGKNTSYNDALKTMPQLGIMMTFAELEFIKAEFALKGFVTGKTPKAHYEAGITASMAQWGATMPVGYLTQPGVVFNDAASVNEKLEKIMEQKYFSFFFVDYQSWFEKRRTGFPVLPRGTGIPAENTFPFRVPYPTYLQSLNSANLAAAATSIGGDNSKTKVWWDQ